MTHQPIESSEGHHYRGGITGGQWVDASKLQQGFKLLDESGLWQEVVSVQVKPEPLQAYNLTIDQTHTYFIKGVNGVEGVWVHNNCWDKLPNDAVPTGKTTPDGRTLYTFKDKEGKQVTAYQGSDGRWYDPKVYSPDKPTATGAKAQDDTVFIENVKWTAHGYKHNPPKNLDWSEIVDSTKSGPAKYRPEIDIQKFEMQAYKNGTPVTNGKPWKVMEFPNEIGASEGKSSRWVRIELSSGTIHGHPISEAEFRSLTK